MEEMTDQKEKAAFGSEDVIHLAVDDLISRFDFSMDVFHAEAAMTLVSHVESLSVENLKKRESASQILCAASRLGMMGVVCFSFEVIVRDIAKFSALLQAPGVPDIERLILLTPLASLARARLRFDMFSEERLERVRMISEGETVS